MKNTAANETSNATRLIAAISAGVVAGGDETEWDDPEFKLARDLTAEFGCEWDFTGWRDTLDCVVHHLRLGGVDLS